MKAREFQAERIIDVEKSKRGYKIPRMQTR
jgi:hypothetical protein